MSPATGEVSVLYCTKLSMKLTNKKLKKLTSMKKSRKKQSNKSNE